MGALDTVTSLESLCHWPVYYCQQVGLAAAQRVHASLRTLSYSTAFSGIETNYNDLAALAWPVVGTIVGGFVLLKLFKKFANKAS